ncbi:MAG: RS21-C6 protein [Bernardetiaceae bacterium]|nr:RS21-C6 protein [Bernardetiaceae bacterium]
MDLPILKENPSLRDLQTYIKDLCAARGWDANSHLEIFLLLSEELGELARAIRDETGLHSQVVSDKAALASEFADVLNYFLDLANYFEIDLEEAFRKKDEINRSRSWG